MYSQHRTGNHCNEVPASQKRSEYGQSSLLQVSRANHAQGNQPIDVQRRPTSQVQGSQLSQVQQDTRPNVLPMRRTAPFGVRRYFPSRQRPLSSTRQGRRKTTATSDNRPFLRDLILLSGPSDTTVPRRRVRVELSEHGHIITGCQFTKNMTAAQVKIRIMEVFEEKIPRLVDIEFFNVCSHRVG